MHTPEEIRTIEFQKSMSGYKTSDVEIFLDELADQIEGLVKENSDLNKKLEELNVRVEKDTEEKNSLQNVLLSAQVLADKIVADAEKKGADLIKEAEAKVEEIRKTGEDLKAKNEKEIADRKAEADEEVANTLAKSVKKSEALLAAAQDSVDRQQLLFDKLKISVATMKKELVGIYKNQLEFVTTMPDEVPLDAEHAAAAITVELEKSPDYAKMVKEVFAKDKEEKPAEKEEKSKDKKTEAKAEAKKEEVVKETKENIQEKKSGKNLTFGEEETEEPKEGKKGIFNFGN